MKSTLAAQPPLRSRRKVDISQIGIISVLVVWGIIVLYPFYNSVLVSIVPMSVYVREPFMLYPPAFDFSSYKFILSWSTLITGFKTTFIILVFGVAYNLFLTVTMAYVLSKPIPGRSIVNFLVVFTMFFQGGLIPSFLLVKNLGLIDSYAAMILPVGIGIMNMMIMRSYFYTIPIELEEAARLDGAGEFTILWKVFLPLSMPMLATIGLYYSVDRWNEWYHGMLYMRSVDKWPVQLLIRNMIASTATITNQMPESARPTVFAQGIQMAAVIVTIIPVAILYPFLQKYFVKGLTLGGIKG
ncbi:MAG: binding-protein-dependent transport system inner rane component [Paenibacillaceae bacterium]|jgi:putative aldouronate transport system permease protein|nr:binding-protein-dependent transport system inner rane component [Paenibacillaceae bacterium]